MEGALTWITTVLLMSNFFALECYCVNIIDLHLHCWVDKPGFGNNTQTQIIHPVSKIYSLAVQAVKDVVVVIQSSEDTVVTTPKKSKELNVQSLV